MKSLPFEKHNSYCPALTRYEILLQGVAASSAIICIACLLMGKPHLCFSTSSRTFSLVTLKFHCLGTLFYKLEFSLFDNCFILFSIIHPAPQHAVSVLQCCCWFLCMFFCLVKSTSYLQHIGVGIVDTVAHFSSTGSPMAQSIFENLPSDEMLAHWL